MSSIRIGRIDDIAKIHENISDPFYIRNDTVVSLINMNGCLILENEDKDIIGISLMAVAINDSGTGSIAKVIGIWGEAKEQLMILSAHITNLVTEVHFSQDCMKRMEIPTTGKDQWYKLGSIIESLKDKIYLDKSIYSKSFLDIKKVFTKISDELNEKSVTKNEWLNVEDKTAISTVLGSKIVEHCPGVYSFPFISNSMCRRLLRKANAYEYEVNDCEDSPYQMPEVVLSEKDVVLYEKMLALFMSNIPDITNVLYARKTIEINSVQLARYSPNTISTGNWHHDEDSDITLVVSLSNSHEGGGTMIHPYGIGDVVVVPQLPAGHALLFRGKHYLHKGMPVTKGERNILVFWTAS